MDKSNGNGKGQIHDFSDYNGDITTINFLTTYSDEWVILIDTFKNPVRVNRVTLLEKLSETYKSAMDEWYTEWTELEKKR